MSFIRLLLNGSTKPPELPKMDVPESSTKDPFDYTDRVSSRHLPKCARSKRDGSVVYMPDGGGEGFVDLQYRTSQSPCKTMKRSACNQICCSREVEEDSSTIDNSCQFRTGPFCHENGQHINGSSMLLLKLRALYETEDLSDIEIAVGCKVFHVHKLLLCISSDVFKVMLTNPSWPESQHNRVVLKEEPQCMAVFELFLQFFYTGCTQLNHVNVLPILMLADKYNVCDLRHICIEYMCNHVVSIIRQNHAISWFQYARLCGHTSLAYACLKFIKCNFHKVVCTEDFLQLDKDILIDVLQDSGLVVPDEYTLFRSAVRWLNHQEIKMLSQPGTYSQLVLEVLSCVRFPLMPPSHLKLIETEPLTFIYKEFFREKVTEAIRFHSSLQNERKQMASASHSSENFTARNYTSDHWGTVFCIDNFCSLPENEVRPMIFNSPVSSSEADDNRSWEWNVDLYPKGVLFQKCILIGLWRNLEICGTLYNTVRLTLEAKGVYKRNVEVAILITGVQDGIEYIRRVIQRRCSFGLDNKIYNFNDLVPYEELNCVDSPYLSGADGNAFKITIIIKPV